MNSWMGMKRKNEVCGEKGGYKKNCISYVLRLFLLLTVSRDFFDKQIRFHVAMRSCLTSDLWVKDSS